MERIVLFIIFILGFSVNIKSQTIINTSNLMISENVKLNLNNRNEVENYELIEFNNNLINDSIFNINVFDFSIQLKKKKFEIRKEYNYTLIASNIDLDELILSVNKDEIDGTLTCKGNIYRIENINNQIIISKINQSKFPKEHCQKETENIPNNSSPNFNSEKENVSKRNINSNITYPEQALDNFICKIRILAQYTTQAKNAKSSIENLIQLSIDQLNQSFLNSNVYFQAELVFVGEINETESSIIDDVLDYQSIGDGRFESVHELKKKYSADLCVLFVNDYSMCGIARAIKACNNYGYCLVSWSCATTNYSFAHEIGHLIGARHDLITDNDLTPYEYGHGYISPNKNWRTIMAQGKGCNGCNRILYWSNPNITLNGIVMGNTTNCNNARLLNTYIPNVMSFRNKEGVRLIQQSDINNTNGTIYHANKIQTDGVVIIPNGYNWRFIAGNEIVFSNDFITETGCHFETQILPNCGIADNEVCNYNDDFDNFDFTINNKKNQFEVYPNPTSQSFKIINYKIDEKIEEIEIELINSLGQILKKTSFLTKYQIEFNISEIPSGVYFVRIFEKSSKIHLFKVIKI
jgi:hypothetical protein